MGYPSLNPLIRVDTHGARDQAANYSILKAKKIIDEKGDKLF